MPDISDIPDIIACEVNTDGFYDFDLETVTSELLGSQDPANFTVTYHETQKMQTMEKMHWLALIQTLQIHSNSL